MSASSDYYRILGVPPTADRETIRRAYREQVAALHPDRRPGDPAAEERFKLLQEAYAVLGTPERRRAYDGRRLRTVFGPVSLSAEAPACACAAAEALPHGALHVHRRVAIPFEKALQGGHVAVALPTGEVIQVTVPRGCRHLTTVRVRNRGQVRDGLRGDLLVTFEVQPHPRFRREGNHLHVIERISAVEAMLGTERTITNPYGHVIRVTIPAGTQPGERFRVRGQGVVTSVGTGDLFVEVDVEVPRTLSEAQRARLREVLAAEGLLEHRNGVD